MSTSASIESATSPMPATGSPIWGPRMHALLRFITGIVLLSFGTQKLFGVPPRPPQMPTLVLMSQVGLAGILETFGGFAIAIGWFTRPVAFVLAGEMAVAYFQAHFPTSFWPSVNMGTPAILNCFIFLFLAAAGAGPWSVDGVRARRRNAALR